MIGPRCLISSRAKTSLPPPGLEWVTSVTVLCGYFAGAAAIVMVETAMTATAATNKSLLELFMFPPMQAVCCSSNARAGRGYFETEQRYGCAFLYLPTGTIS